LRRHFWSESFGTFTNVGSRFRLYPRQNIVTVMAWDTASIGAKGKTWGIFGKGRFANIAKKSLTSLKIGQAF